MSKFKIAIANDIDIFNIENLLNIDFARKYHAIGIHFLIKEIKENNYEIVWADTAIENINNGDWNAKDVLIIQEMSSKNGKILEKLGSIPFLCMCFEGPFIGHWFYEKINKFGKKFNKILIFDDQYHSIQFDKKKILNLGFPCVDENQLNNSFQTLNKQQWDRKKLIVGIWSNKHYSLHLKKIINHLKKFHFKYLILEIISKILSKTYKKNLKNQIIDKRNQVFLNLSALNNFDLFGRGWSDSIEMPSKIYKKIQKFKKNIYDGNDQKFKKLSKKEIFSNYKFCLCFENSISRSYVTEKIFDCLNAKVIPIYLGAPNINEFLPKECFIDFREFNDEKNLNNFLTNMNVDDANKYLDAAYNFLCSVNIKRNSCQFFSKQIINEIKNYSIK